MQKQLARGPSHRCRVFLVAREGHSASECQDAVAFDLQGGRFAAADGASESASCAAWARLLVDAFVQAPRDQVAWPAWLAPLRNRWAEATRRPEGAEPLPWYVEAQQRHGAFSTFLGLSMEGPRWAAQVVGDSCLFQVRAGQLVVAFPLSRASQFTDSPWLVGSLHSSDWILARQAQVMMGEWRPGDQFFLMTDALARWFLTGQEMGRQNWREVTALAGQSDDAFVAWVSHLRATRQLRNDDVALAAITV